MAIDLSAFEKEISAIQKMSLAVEAERKAVSPKVALRQPVHVVYGGAHLFQKDFEEKFSRLSSESLTGVAADGLALKALLRETWSPAFSERVYKTVLHKLKTHPVEDYRIDFEDGYGVRSDEEEDDHAIRAAKILAESRQLGASSSEGPKCSQVGIRIKAFTSATVTRSIRTLSTFVQAFVEANGIGGTLTMLPVTLPKVTHESQVEALVGVLEALETKFTLPANFFVIELLIETPEALMSLDGSVRLPKLLVAAKGRCTGLHFGVYDFTSNLGIGSAGQSLDHMSCDAARFWMQLVASNVPGVSLSDGIINTLPVPPHRARSGITLLPHQLEENRKVTGEAWRFNYQQMLRSLKQGFYQGWDLHPAQVAVRHLVNHVYVLQEFDHAAKRLKGFLDRSAQAVRHGAVFDDRASAVGLVLFMERALTSGIISEEDLTVAKISVTEMRSLL